ncbi:hypothetical protein NC651_032790 [Populus alba x Populus x berolinensis]|nr:hypothetical protein NC651_032790 [Populus alba x Populus x berolinensis]
MTAFGHLIRRGLAARLSYRVKRLADLSCCDHVLEKRVFSFDSHFGFLQVLSKPNLCHATELHLFRPHVF